MSDLEWLREKSTGMLVLLVLTFAVSLLIPFFIACGWALGSVCRAVLSLRRRLDAEEAEKARRKDPFA